MWKKTISLLILIVVIVFSFAACSCEHNWSDASCEEASVCLLCGDIKGEALGHSWKDATYESPKTCINCGKTEGKALPVIQVVKKAYKNAISLAEENNKEHNYAYTKLHNELFKLLADVSIDKYSKTDVEKYFGKVKSTDETIKILTKTLTYVLTEGDDCLSALMRMLQTSKYVEGTITVTYVDIEVKDVALLLKELHIKPNVLGAILAMLDIYDYTRISQNGPLLSFTETGFTYHWESLTNYVLNLQYQGSKLTEEDFVIRILDEGAEDVDTINEFKNLGSIDTAYIIYDDKNMEEDDEDNYKQILTNRGIYTGSDIDTVFIAYGQTELYKIDTDGLPHQTTLKSILRTDSYMNTLFERRCKTYVMYDYGVYDICICFDDDKVVSWIIYFYNGR